MCCARPAAARRAPAQSSPERRRSRRCRARRAPAPHSPAPRAGRSASRTGRSRESSAAGSGRRRPGPASAEISPRRRRAESRLPAPARPPPRPARCGAEPHRQRAGGGSHIRVRATARRSCLRPRAPTRRRRPRREPQAVPPGRHRARCIASPSASPAQAASVQNARAQRDPRRGRPDRSQRARRLSGRVEHEQQQNPASTATPRCSARCGADRQAASNVAPSTAIPAVAKPGAAVHKAIDLPETSRFGAQPTKLPPAVAAAAAITSVNRTGFRIASGLKTRRGRGTRPGLEIMAANAST